MDKKCNFVSDCEGSEDEMACNLIKTEDGYRKDFPPFEPDGKGGINKANVNLTVHIIDILTVSELDALFGLKFSLSLSWYDRRLGFATLKKGDPNIIGEDEQKHIWIPEVVFDNTKDLDSTVNDYKASLVV